MIKYLLEKEFKQLLRNPMLPRMLLVFPCIILLVLPWAANFEIKNMNLSIVDNDRSPYSTRLVQKVGASEYFHLIDVSNNYQEAMQCIEKGDADLILEIPPHFERDLLKTGVAKVLVSANTVNGTKGTLGSSYLSNIVNAYATEIRISHSGSISPSPVIKIDTQGRFNPYLDYKVFMVPALMAQLLMMLCGFLPALNIVSEKEFGTIEQINVTPVSKFTFILAKLIPYWVTGMLILTISIILAWLVYGLVPAGHLWLLYFFALLFIIVISGMGLVVSNYSRTMQQAMFVMFFFVIIIMLDKVMIVRKYVEEKGLSIPEGLSNNAYFDEAARQSGMSPHELTDFLWNTYHPSQIWMVLMVVGVGAAFALFVYDRVTSRSES